MIIYVESNFILEVALQQRESPAAESILKLAESGQVELAFPDFALSEPFATVMHFKSERQNLRDSSERILNQLKQSELSDLHIQVVSALQPMMVLVTRIVEREFSLLHSTVERMLSVGKSIELNISCFKQALVYQGRFDFKPQDSIIYACVVADLQMRPHDETKCFLNRNWKDFDDPDVKSELESYNCRYVSSFKEGLRYIQRYA